jgi:hypothetical protein
MGEGGAFSQLEDSISASTLPTTLLKLGRFCLFSFAYSGYLPYHPNTNPFASSHCFLITIISLDLSHNGTHGDYALFISTSQLPSPGPDTEWKIKLY